MASAADAAALKLEIARLTGAINQRRSGDVPPARPQSRFPASRPHAYVNPSYKPQSRPASFSAAFKSTPSVRPPTGPSQTLDITINGVAFEKSSRSLVRKDLAITKPVAPPVVKPRPPRPTRPSPEFTRTKAGHLIKTNRVYKPKPSRHGNMTLANARRPYQPRRPSKKSIDKPCPRFNTTGACNRALTCPYKHDPAKIAICWPFLHGTCPHTADTCALSHDPTPERTPLCVHFANNGRCTRVGCPYPHVGVGARAGVCRDFAVLGFCSKALDCEHQHVRECPDFAENGACPNPRCKLPHVIRANRNRKPALATTSAESTTAATLVTQSTSGTSDVLQPAVPPSATAEDARLGDEYISLTFNESESEEETSAEEEDNEEEEDEDAEDSDEEEGDEGPTGAAESENDVIG